MVVQRGNSGYNNAANNNLVKNITIQTFRCPSSPVPDFMAGRGGVNGPLMNHSYTGIAGPALGVAGTTTYNVGCCNGSGPLASVMGILYAGSKTRMTDITDGTSNTWLIGEQSDHLRDASGLPVTAGFTAGVGNSGGMYGWTMGAQHPIGGNGSNWGDGRHFNCTTVRYQPNQRGIVTTAGGTSATGTNNDVGTNFPLSSGHTGGVIVGMGDGSIRFVRNSITTVNMSAYCTRAGNEVITDDN